LFIFCSMSASACRRTRAKNRFVVDEVDYAAACPTSCNRRLRFSRHASRSEEVVRKRIDDIEDGTHKELVPA
jgi:hypothetical protein